MILFVKCESALQNTGFCFQRHSHPHKWYLMQSPEVNQINIPTNSYLLLRTGQQNF